MKKALSLLAVMSVFFSACVSENTDVNSSRTVMLTDGVMHSVPLDEILPGGPPKDGIPSIDSPVFVSVEEADSYLDDEGLGIALSFDGIDRFYPFQILVWHEIVNDTVGSQPALVTYCPLCGSGVAFSPVVNGQVTEFGTSGKLWNSNLVMYDRQTDSYWSQILGESILGEMTGTRLELIPYFNMTWSRWKELNPDGEVLSNETGFLRDYTNSPYGDYDENEVLFFPVQSEDDRFHPKAPLYGIEVDGEFKAYFIEDLEAQDVNFEDKLNGVPLQVTYDEESQFIGFMRMDKLEEITPFYSFWFSWFAAHPDTEVFRAE